MQYERVYKIGLTLFENAGYGPEQRVHMAEKHAESTVQEFRFEPMGFDLYIKKLTENKKNLGFIKNLILIESL